MSLSASMWTGVSGMLSHAEKLNVIGNNIANVNTIGYKSQRMDFADLMYTNTYTDAGLQQMGMGVKSQTIITSFTQGAFESSTNATDLAISGNGFFKVVDSSTGSAYYTRAGNLNFDKNGNLNDPNGFTLQGWPIETVNGVERSSGGLSSSASNTSTTVVGTGSPQNIVLDAWTVQPFATTKTSFIANLSSDSSYDNVTNSTNPFASLFSIWDGTQDTPIPSTAAAYTMTMDVYDEAGVMHTISVYFDKIDTNSYDGAENGTTTWEFIVTMEPEDDQRQYWQEDSSHPDGGYLANFSDSTMAGMLGSGTITFNSAGMATNQSFYTFMGALNPTDDPSYYTQVADPNTGALSYVPSLTEAQNVEDLNLWKAAEVSASGYPMYTPNFSGLLDANSSGSENGANHSIELSFGMSASDLDNPWTQNKMSSLADMTVEPYYYNTSYDPTDATTGPKYILENQYYSSSIETSVETLLDEITSNWSKLSPVYNEDPTGTGVNRTLSFYDVIEEFAEYGYSDKLNALVVYADDGTVDYDATNTLKQELMNEIAKLSDWVDPDNINDYTDERDAFDAVLGSAGIGLPGYTFVTADTWTIPGDATSIVTEYDSDGNIINTYGAGDTVPADANVSIDYMDFDAFFYGLSETQRDMYIDSIATGNNVKNDDTGKSYTVAEIKSALTSVAADIKLTMNKAFRGEFDNPYDNSEETYSVDLYDATGAVTDTLTINIANLSNAVIYYAIESHGSNYPDKSVFKETDASNATDLAIFTQPVVIEDNAIQSQAGSSATYGGTSQNGYGFGNLSSYYVTSDGILTGTYSNGVSLPLYQICMYDFVSPQNLRAEGGNLYSQTYDSGEPSSGPCGVAGLGTIQSYAIEQSNVDLSREFVLMITTQRGFQGNSKTVSTVDTMLESVINLKR